MNKFSFLTFQNMNKMHYHSSYCDDHIDRDIFFSFILWSFLVQAVYDSVENTLLHIE